MHFATLKSPRSLTILGRVFRKGVEHPAALTEQEMTALRADSRFTIRTEEGAASVKPKAETTPAATKAPKKAAEPKDDAKPAAAAKSGNVKIVKKTKAAAPAQPAAPQTPTEEKPEPQREAAKAESGTEDAVEV